MVNGGCSVFGCDSLFGKKFAEGNNKFVIDGTVIVDDISYYSLGAFNVIFVEVCYGSGFIGVLELGYIGDSGVFMGQYLLSFGGSVIVLGEEIGDIVFHCEAAGAFGVIPVEVDSGEAVSVPLLCDVIVLLEDIT